MLFFEDPDSLSQWRAYDGRTSGFAIGFNPEHLTQVVKRTGFYLARCLYEPAEQNAVVEALIDDVLTENLERINRGERLFTDDYIKAPSPSREELLSPRGGNQLAYLNRFAPILKDRAFIVEKEWRVISKPLMRTGERFSSDAATQW